MNIFIAKTNHNEIISTPFAAIAFFSYAIDT
jgi:hypothetical protein